MSRPYYVQVSGLQTTATDNPRRFRKQLAYVDKFGKRSVDGVQSFELTEGRLNSIKDETNRMLSNGVRVFGPVGHSNDEKNNHATWDNFTTGLDDKGRFSLFAEVEPVDDKATDLVKRSDVSVYLDPDYMDGRKNTYTELVRHVAFTPKPVIPDLGPFTPILASEAFDVVQPNTEESNMPHLTEFATALGITLSEDASENDNATAILEGISKLGVTLSEHKAMIDNLKKKKKDDEVDEDGNPIKKKKEKMAVSASESPIICRLAQENWTAKINSLSPTNISPATAKKLVSEFCSTDAVKQSLALSEDGENTMLDRLIDSLKENTTGISTNGSTGPQGDVVELSEDVLNDPKQNPLVSSAMELAEARS